MRVEIGIVCCCIFCLHIVRFLSPPLYDGDVRGPLDVLREEWDASKKSDESILSHILLVRKRLEEISELVSENLKGAHAEVSETVV